MGDSETVVAETTAAVSYAEAAPNLVDGGGSAVTEAAGRSTFSCIDPRFCLEMA